MAAKKRNRAGRRRKASVPRYEDGRITRQGRKLSKQRQEVANKRVALTARMRHTGLPYNDAKDQNAGTPYGIMYLRGDLSKPQLEAAEWYFEIVSRLYQIKGWPLPHVRSSAGAMVSVFGASLSEGPDETSINKAWQVHENVVSALVIAGGESGRTKGRPDHLACKRIVHSLCFEQSRDICAFPLSDEEFGNFRCGLNAVHRLFKTS